MLQKRLDYGFNGYQVPFFPRARRSSRRRGTIQKKVEDDNKMCAFDVLASVAGKLLLEGETHNTYTGKDQAVNGKDVVMEEQLEGNPLQVDNCDKGFVGIPSLSLELGLQIPAEKCNISSRPGSMITLSDCLEKDTSVDKTDIGDDKSELCSHSIKSEGLSPVHGEGELLLGNSGETKFPDGKPHALVSTDSSIRQALGEDKCRYDSSCSPSKGNNLVVVGRDDDENYSECTRPSTMKTTRSPARIGDRRIRKLLASKYWRVAPKVKDGDFSDTELRCVYRNRRMGYKRQRSQRIYPFKKRKFVRYSSISSSERDIGCKGFRAVGHGVDGSSSCVAGQSTPFQSRESHVKLRIKSFRVPELFVEMPETATIGLLKRTVMETVTALLGGGLHVGVLLQGKKIRDDSRTLLQSGIYHDGKVQSLGVTLEPNPSYTNPRVCSEDNSYMLSTDVPDSTRCPPTSTINWETSHLSTDHPVNNMGNFIESDHDSTPSPAKISAEKGTVDSQALISFPEEPPQALAVVPSHKKSNRSEIAQRRIRRPFSVAEVEALVHAVEKLGTGRWRDVKLRAFDNAKHRTYVDLKDKWKTLVHTAKISPQQRRGQPVPQELLDRVLAAHSYWSLHQAKHQLKQAEPAFLL